MQLPHVVVRVVLSVEIRDQPAIERRNAHPVQLCPKLLEQSLRANRIQLRTTHPP